MTLSTLAYGPGRQGDDVAHWLRAIAYGIIPGTPQQRSVAGFFLTELFDAFNYRLTD